MVPITQSRNLPRFMSSLIRTVLMQNRNSLSCNSSSIYNDSVSACSTVRTQFEGHQSCLGHFPGVRGVYTAQLLIRWDFTRRLQIPKLITKITWQYSCQAAMIMRMNFESGFHPGVGNVSVYYRLELSVSDSPREKESTLT